MWQPITAGILIILSTFIGAWAFLDVVQLDFVYRILVDIAALLIMSTKYAAFTRRHWKVALAGAICSIFAFPVFPIFGIFAVVLLITGKSTFR